MSPVLLIGLDGATFDVLDPYVADGTMPNLGRLYERGSRGVLRSIMPPLTPPAWTSLVTGKHPGEHGVFDFFQKEEPGSVYFTFVSSHHVGSATIWSLASDQGRRIVSLNFPLMFPPPSVTGAVVPGGMMPWRQLRLGCHPPGLFDQLKALPAFEPREMLDMELEIKAVDGCPEDEFADFVDLHIRRERRWAAVLDHLLVHEQPDLAAVLFDGVDKLQHLCWRFIDPACRPAQPTAWERSMVERCRRYFASLDELIGAAIDRAGPQTTVVLASDHGFGPTRDVFHVNSWLAEQGYLHWADQASAPTRGDTEIGFAEMTRHVRALDWSRTVAYAATPSSQGIHIVETVPGTSDPMPEETRARVACELAELLLQIERPWDGAPLVETVWTREQAFPGPYEAYGPDLSMVLTDGGTISILPSSTIMARRPQVRGHHRWEGIFLAAGPGLRAGAEIDELSILDIAPLIMHRLGLPIPADMSGRLPREAYEPEELRRDPPRHGQPTPQAPTRMPAPELAPEEQTAVMNRLRALGYVE